MKNISTIKIIAAIVIVAVVAGAGYAIARKNKNPQPAGGVTVDQKQDVSAGKKMAFADFVKEGGSYQCTVNQNVQNIETKGTVYISGERISGTFSTKTQGMNIDTNMIVRDGYTYTWSSMMQGMGVKIKATSPGAAGSNPGASASGTYSFNAEQIGDYDCKPWTANESVFTLPSGITFQAL